MNKPTISRACRLRIAEWLSFKPQISAASERALAAAVLNVFYSIYPQHSNGGKNVEYNKAVLEAMAEACAYDNARTMLGDSICGVDGTWTLWLHPLDPNFV